MDKMQDIAKCEKEVGTSMAKFQQFIKELTGIDPRGGQIGPLEIYKIARKAAKDEIEASKSKIVAG